MVKPKSVKLASFSFNADRPRGTIVNGLNTMQRRGIDALKDVRWGVCDAPTGSGKTRLMLMLALMRAEDEGLGIIVATSMRAIKRGFMKPFTATLPNGRVINYKGIPLQAGRVPHVGVREIVAFAQRTDFSTPEIKVVTHQTMAMALRDQDENFTFKNVVSVPDEVHRSSSKLLGHSMEDAELDQNWLSRAIERAVKDFSSVYACTATCSRTDDRERIIPPTVADEFALFTYPFYDYIDDIRLTIDMNYVTGEPWAVLDFLTSDDLSNTLLVLPNVQTSLYKYYGKGGVLEYLKKRGIQYIDIVETEGREELVDDLAKRIEDKETLPLIVVQDCFREGWDCPQPKRVIVLGAKRTVNTLNQLIGRGSREFPGKDLLTIDFYMPFGENKEEPTHQDVEDHLMDICEKLCVVKLLKGELELVRLNNKVQTMDTVDDIHVPDDGNRVQAASSQSREQAKLMIGRIAEEFAARSEGDNPPDVATIIEEMLEERGMDVKDTVYDIFSQLSAEAVRIMEKNISADVLREIAERENRKQNMPEMSNAAIERRRNRALELFAEISKSYSNPNVIASMVYEQLEKEGEVIGEGSVRWLLVCEGKIPYHRDRTLTDDQRDLFKKMREDLFEQLRENNGRGKRVELEKYLKKKYANELEMYRVKPRHFYERVAIFVHQFENEVGYRIKNGRTFGAQAGKRVQPRVGKKISQHVVGSNERTSPVTSAPSHVAQQPAPAVPPAVIKAFELVSSIKSLFKGTSSRV